jgi:hypothetical protein
MMDREHIAAAIEHFIEKVKAEQRVYEMRADDCRREARELSEKRTAVMEGGFNERELREIYREVKVIIMGGE